MRPEDQNADPEISKDLPDLEQFLELKYKEINDGHFSAWLNSRDKSISLSLVGGGKIEHQGVFSDEAKSKFWDESYIPEFIEQYCFEMLDSIEEQVHQGKNRLNKNKELKRCKKEFKLFINKVFARMQEVEKQLLAGLIKFPGFYSEVANKISEEDFFNMI